MTRVEGGHGGPPHWKRNAGQNLESGARRSRAYVAMNFLTAAATERWSDAVRTPALFTIRRLSRVNSFILTFDAARSPALPESINTSIGHGGFVALVIIASR